MLDQNQLQHASYASLVHLKVKFVNISYGVVAQTSGHSCYRWPGLVVARWSRST